MSEEFTAVASIGKQMNSRLVEFSTMDVDSL